jgi:transcriptional regulator GlxA family with amidase domain
LPARELRRVSAELEQLAEECEASHPNALLVRAMLLKILVLLARAYHWAGGEGQSAEELPRGQMVWAALAEIEEALERRAAPEFDRIAANRGITPDHFRRLFKQETGWSPLGFYQQRRVQTAARMLLNPNHTITEVAIELGFSDTPHFSRTFREHQGLSPREYRRIYRS